MSKSAFDSDYASPDWRDMFDAGMMRSGVRPSFLETTDEQPTPRLRYIQPKHTMRLTLQQAWLVTYYRDGRPWKQFVDWRDIPVVAE